jgi:FixJ family two-component response regulator
MTGAPLVLVVDDDDSVRRSLSRLLSAAGYRVETFAGASELLARAAPRQPACALVDVRMPEVSGFELVEALNASHPDVAVVFISGHGDIPMAVRAIKAGASDFLTKPFDESALLAAVDQAIATSRERLAARGD